MADKKQTLQEGLAAIEASRKSRLQATITEKEKPTERRKVASKITGLRGLNPSFGELGKPTKIK
jgi:hypothetical protein